MRSEKTKVLFGACPVLVIAVALLTIIAVQAATVTISEQYGMVWITPSGHEYCVQNNVWNPSSGWVQTLEVDDWNGDFSVVEANHNKSTSGSPASFPSIFKGNHWGTATNNSGMPIQVDQIDALNTMWDITPVSSGAWNAVYDIWFHKTADYSNGSPNGAELMIWINYLGPIQPAGTQVATVDIAGTTWEVWFADWSGWDYIAYRRTTKTTSANFDINTFIEDAVSRGYIGSSWHLISVEAGFELWQGGAGLESSGFSLTVEGVAATTTAPTTTMALPATTALPTTPQTTPPSEAPWAWVGVGITIAVITAVVALVLKGRGK